MRVGEHVLPWLVYRRLVLAVADPHKELDDVVCRHARRFQQSTGVLKGQLRLTLGVFHYLSGSRVLAHGAAGEKQVAYLRSEGQKASPLDRPYGLLRESATLRVAPWFTSLNILDEWVALGQGCRAPCVAESTHRVG